MKRLTNKEIDELAIDVRWTSAIDDLRHYKAALERIAAGNAGVLPEWRIAVQALADDENKAVP